MRYLVVFFCIFNKIDISRRKKARTWRALKKKTHQQSLRTLEDVGQRGIHAPVIGLGVDIA